MSSDFSLNCYAAWKELLAAGSLTWFPNCIWFDYTHDKVKQRATYQVGVLSRLLLLDL